MLFHVLAVLDIICAIILVGGHAGFLKIPLMYAAIYLVSKLLFFRDVLTTIDAVIALYFLYVFFVGGTAFTWLVVLYVAYKTFVWFFYSFAQ